MKKTGKSGNLGKTLFDNDGSHYCSTRVLPFLDTRLPIPLSIRNLTLPQSAQIMDTYTRRQSMKTPTYIHMTSFCFIPSFSRGYYAVSSVSVATRSAYDIYVPETYAR